MSKIHLIDSDWTKHMPLTIAEPLLEEKSLFSLRKHIQTVISPCSWSQRTYMPDTHAGTCRRRADWGRCFISSCVVGLSIRTRDVRDRSTFIPLRWVKNQLRCLQHRLFYEFIHTVTWTDNEGEKEKTWWQAEVQGKRRTEGSETAEETGGWREDGAEGEEEWRRTSRQISLRSYQ